MIKLRIRKCNSERFATYLIDEDTYDLDELQEIINHCIRHKTPATIAVDMPKKKLVKFKPADYDSISVIRE